MSNLKKVIYSDFSESNDFYKFLKESDYTDLEVEFGEEIINNIKKNDSFNKGDGPFNGYWQGFLTTATLTETSMILKRKDFRKLTSSLIDLVFDAIESDCKVTDMTQLFIAEKNKFNTIDDAEFSLIVKKAFRNLFERGTNFKGFECKFRTTDDSIFLEKELYCDYAVEFYSVRNVPNIAIFEINKESLGEKSIVTKDNCKPLTTVRYKDYEKMFSQIDISESKVLVLPSEFSHFYGFGDNYFVKLTEAKVDRWWNEECCDNFVKVSLNLNKTANDFGLSFICWEDTLIESSFYKDYISEDITQEEFKSICKNRMHTSIAESIINVFESKKLDENDKNRIQLEITNLEKSIQNTIDSNKNEILLTTAKQMLPSDGSISEYSFEELTSLLRSINTGLDCGFLYFGFKDEKLNDLFKKAEALKIRNMSLNIDAPIFVQSTTIQGYMAQEIVKIVKSELDIDLYYWTVLD